MKKFGYRKLFKKISPYFPKFDDLCGLAEIMSGKIGVFSHFNNNNWNAINNEVGHFVHPQQTHQISAGYTYLSQFISHDITFDEASDRHNRKDFPLGIIAKKKLKKLKNLRTPFLNLETIYGKRENQNEIDLIRTALMLQNYHLPLLKIGETFKDIESGMNSFPCDLPRYNDKLKAQIIDSRNDENLLLAQTQVAFMKFHNALVVKLNENGKYTYWELFEKARKIAIRLYQTIIIKDYLPQIAQKEIIKEVLYRIKSEEPASHEFKIPLEFSVAAFRFGHSMIRNVYNINKLNPESGLSNLMIFTGFGGMRLNNNSKVKSLASQWIINWNNFYSIDLSLGNPEPQMAEPINTDIATRLMKLVPIPKETFGGRVSSLSAIDLLRGRRFGLPSGQDICIEYGKQPISCEIISDLILSKKLIGNPSEEIQIKTKEKLKNVFSHKTPLWFYILAEAEKTGKGKLGEIGSRIVVETILNLIYYSDYSVLQQDLEEEELLIIGNEDGTFKMSDMLKFIQDACYSHFDQLYPKTKYPNTKKEFDELNPLEKLYQ